MLKNVEHTDCIAAKSFSPLIENRVLDSIRAKVSGCKLRIADFASLDINGSNNKSNHLCLIS